jgi:hypothetical protein
VIEILPDEPYDNVEAEFEEVSEIRELNVPVPTTELVTIIGAGVLDDDELVTVDPDCVVEVLDDMSDVEPLLAIDGFGAML